jgi:hypothetical protein
LSCAECGSRYSKEDVQQAPTQPVSLQPCLQLLCSPCLSWSPRWDVYPSPTVPPSHPSAALTESCQQLTAIGLECGIASQLARQLVTAHLSGCTSKTEVKEEPPEQPPPQQQAANTPTASGPPQMQQGEAAAPKSTGGRTPATRVALAPLTLSAQGGEALASAAAAGCGAAVEGQENVVRPNHQQAAPKGAGTASGRKMALRGQAPLSSKRTRV